MMKRITMMAGMVIIITIFSGFHNFIFASMPSETPSGIPISDLRKEIDTFLEDQVGVTIPGLAIAVVKDRKIIFIKGYGYADRSNQTAVDPKTTIFEFGSITKLLVWNCAMQLVENGKLDLNDDIKQYLPDDFNAKLNYQYPITMYDLMHHTAGFEQTPYDWLPIPANTIIHDLETNLMMYEPKQIYKPGEVIAYSNYGASLAGYVIEQISDQKFYDYAKENILEPLSMNKTTINPDFSDKAELLKDKAAGYLPVGNSHFKDSTWSYLWQYPAGSANGTVEDLGKYLIALLEEDDSINLIFTESDTQSEMLTQSYRPNHSMSSNAHGFWEHYNTGTSYWHSGNTASFTSFFAFNPEQSFGVAILTNASLAIEPTYGLAKLLLGSQREEEMVDQEMPLAYDLKGTYIYSMYSETGIYKFASYLTNLVKVDAVDENTLILSSLGRYSIYTQKSPYYYELKETNLSDGYFSQPQLSVEFDGQTIKRLSSGHMMDIIPIPDRESLIYFWFSIVLFLSSLVYFVKAVIVLLVDRFSKRGRISKDINHYNSLVITFNGLGIGLLLNNTIIGYMCFISLYRTDAGMIHFSILNWILICILIPLIFYILVKFKSVSKYRIIRHMTTLILIFNVWCLFYWNFIIFQT